MKSIHELVNEDKVVFCGDYIPQMVYINGAVTEAIEELAKTRMTNVENEVMLQRVAAFADLMDYELEVMSMNEDGMFWYYIEVVSK